MVRILDLDAVRARIDGFVHRDTQEAAVGVDLTVRAVFRVTGPGSLDFGGSEWETAAREKVQPRLRGDGDEYGWWELESGTYVVRYNEALDLDDGRLGHVLPLERLLLAGASHPAFLIDGSRDPLETLLLVGPAGCNLKENCRVSRVVLLERG